MWQSTRPKPSVWCRLFHRFWWFSNDFGIWYTEGRPTFEVVCEFCGQCWTETKDE